MSKEPVLQAAFRYEEKQSLRAYVQHKRRRNSSSDSSILEALPPRLENRAPARRTAGEDHAHCHRSRNTDGVSYEQCNGSEELGHVSSNAEKDSTTYARRSRCKTRPDLYEPKVTRPKYDQKRSAKREQGKAEAPKRKVASLRLPDVSSEYVPTKRLTLKPSHGLGLFDRGRVSSAASSRGLPDLVYSELSFLQKPRGTRIPSLRDPPVLSKRRERAQDAKAQDDLRTSSPPAKNAPRRGDYDRGRRPSVDLPSDVAHAGSTESFGDCPIQDDLAAVRLSLLYIERSADVIKASEAQKNPTDQVAEHFISSDQEDFDPPTPIGEAPPTPLGRTFTWPSTSTSSESVAGGTELCDDDLQTISIPQLTQQELETVEFNKRFWRPHRLY